MGAGNTDVQVQYLGLLGSKGFGFHKVLGVGVRRGTNCLWNMATGQSIPGGVDM